MKDVFSFMYINKRLCIVSCWNSPHYESYDKRKKTAENKDLIFSVQFDKINITFHEWVIVNI